MVPAVLIAASALALQPWMQAPVSSVKFEVSPRSEAEPLAALFGINVGDALSRAEIRSGVQALVASGRFEDVVVLVEETAEGAALTVRIQSADRVSRIEVAGLPRRRESRLRADLGIAAGTFLDVPAFEREVARAAASLKEEGYPSASLEPELDFDASAGTVGVKLSAALGPPRRVARIEVEGASMTEAELWKATGLDPDDTISDRALLAARRRLSRTLHGTGRWKARVSAPETRVEESGTVVRFKVDLGPEFRLDLEGLKADKELQEQVFPFLSRDDEFDDHALDLLERQLRVRLQRSGYLLASASASIGDEGNQMVLKVRVEKGSRTPIRAIRFPGARSVPEQTLTRRVGARTGRPWRWGGEPVDDDTLAADVLSLVGTLQEEGYATARVEAARIVADGDGVVIEFPIEEGAQGLVERVDVAGVPADVTLPELPLTPGGPWSAGAESRAVETVLTALREAGYAEARVSLSRECDAARCSIGLAAEAGEPAVIGRIVVAGLARTRPGVVSKVLGLDPGQATGPQAMLAAQRRLLALGIFEDVSVRPIPGQDSGPRRGVIVDIEEARSRSLILGLGWDNIGGPRGSVTWSEANLFGTGRSFIVDLRYSSRIESWQLTYREPPSLSILRAPLWSSLYRSIEHYDAYDLDRRGLSAEVGDRLKRPRRLALRFDYQNQSNNAPEEILSELEREKQNIRIASLTPILEWDTRDDQFNPHRGLYASASLQVAFKMLRADSAFERLFGSVVVHRPFLGGTLATSLQAGAIWPRDIEEGVGDNLMVPIGVRFFAGGRVTHRAFETDSLGILGQTITCRDDAPTCEEGSGAFLAQGGAGLVFGSVEWRFPVYGPVGGNLFVDAGNNWAGVREVDLGQVRWGAGLGLRVETPVGPVRLEYGFKLDREPWETQGAFFISLGNPY
ncbi:MAG: BamA/TamA family outer membrane protein [Acidobacteriota bacterium]